MKKILLIALLGILTGCGTMVQLNDPSKSSAGLDRANILSPRDILYHAEEKNGIQVSYNLMTDSENRPTFVRLTLLFKNNRGTPVTVQPKITLQDKGGMVLNPYSYEGYMAQGASMAGTQVPIAPPSSGGTYYSSGVVTSNTSGRSYSYSGTTTSVPNPAQSFQQGFAQGAMIGAAIKRRQGEAMMQWASSYWMKSSYDLPADGAAVGAIMYPANALDLPLKLTVEAAGELFVYQSKKFD